MPMFAQEIAPIRSRDFFILSLPVCLFFDPLGSKFVRFKRHPATRLKIWCSLIGIGCLLTAGLISAGPLFVTDDPEPPPLGGWEINVPFILKRTAGQTEMSAPLFDLNYGLPNTQLKLEIPVSIVHSDDDGIAAGLGDLLLGV